MLNKIRRKKKTDLIEEKYIKAVTCAKSILRNLSKNSRNITYPPNKEKQIKTCIGEALTCIPESLFTEFGTNLKECLEWLEKQGEPTEFHIGQVIVNKNNGNMYLIQFIENGCYLNCNSEPICRIGAESDFMLYGKN